MTSTTEIMVPTFFSTKQKVGLCSKIYFQKYMIAPNIKSDLPHIPNPEIQLFIIANDETDKNNLEDFVSECTYFLTLPSNKEFEKSLKILSNNICQFYNTRKENNFELFEKEYTKETLTYLKKLYVEGSPTLDYICSQNDTNHDGIELTGQDNIV